MDFKRKLYRFYLKKVEKVQSNIYSSIYYILHNQLINERNEEDIVELERIAKNTTKKVFEFEYDDKYINTSKLEEVQRDYSKVLSTFHILQLLKTQIMHKFFKYKMDYSYVRPLLKKISQYDSEYKLIKNLTSFTRVKNDIKIFYKTHFLENKEYLSKEINDIKNTMAMNITIPKILSFMTFSYILLILASFIYNQLVLNAFNIHASYYFSINDYLSSNLNMFIDIFISFIFVIFLGYLNISSSIHNMIVRENITYVNTDAINKQTKREDFTLYFLIGALVISIILLYMNDNNLYITFFVVLLTLITLNFMHKLDVWNYIKNKAQVFLLIWFTIVFSLQIFLQYNNTIKNIKDSTHNEQFSIKLKNEKDISKYVYLLSNSKYAFFYSNENNSSLILPNEQIKEININNK